MALMEEEIEVKHQKIFDFLMEKRKQNPELRFLLRMTDTGGKLKKGHWFYGYQEEYLTISFWNAWTHPENGNLNIQFNVKNNGECEIALLCESSQEADILEKVANSFDGFAKDIEKIGQIGQTHQSIVRQLSLCTF
jgi:hypothetical protein